MLQAFSTEINSPLKPPTQNKDGHQPNVNGRKASLSQGSGNAFGVISPSSATRPGTRRRETTDTNPFNAGLTSPTAGRYSREDSSPWAARRGNELRDSEPDDGDAGETQSKLPFGNLVRANTAGSANMGSLWGASNQASTPAGGGFGNFSLSGSSAVGDRKVGGGPGVPGGGSRLAHLMPREPQEGSASRTGDASQQSWRVRPRTDTDPFGDDSLSGSAVLGGAQDTDAADQGHSNRVGVLGTPAKASAGDFGMSGLNLGGHSGDDGPSSPSETNPYRSPHAERHGQEEDEGGPGHLPGLAGQGDAPPSFGSISRGFGQPAFDGSDRSQTSSVGAKGYPLGGLSGWPAPANPSTGTPSQDRPNFSNAFGSSLFSPVGDLQSPGLSNLSSVFGPGSAGLGTGSMGRNSKLGSLFPAAMQAQMQGHEGDQGTGDAFQDARTPGGHPLGAIGRGNLTGPVRDTSSPMRANRGMFEELFPSNDGARSHTALSGSDNQPPGTGSGPQSFTPVTGGMPFSAAPGMAEGPISQVRQMVMPDRMRWVYLDPQGHVQGPFTGLEMNDWYKANFFTPDLRVKKLEDQEFEPLGQLIRRIGNSREPFLVPQIGIPHGPAQQSGPFNPTAGAGAGGGSVVPPLSGVFPSFGRTLTADEQNNLERRKQEEQYMMAQQRDFMMRQQGMPKFPMQGPGLQHHSSAQSLQSQPSFGSMTSPIGVPPRQQAVGASGLQAGTLPEGQPGAPGAGQGNGEQYRPDDMAGLSAVERDILASMQRDDESGAQHQAGSGLNDNDDPEGFKERLKEFHELRARHASEQSAAVEAGETVKAATDASRLQGAGAGDQEQVTDDNGLSLTQQVQQTQAAAAATTLPALPGMPMPFPPPSSTTPLPAPTAQRARSNLPEQYSRSQTATPDATQPPPLAPWARDPGHEGQKGPSLKEIQEAEARKAARAEEAALAMRKAAMEQEATLLREKEKQTAAATTAAGLPASSTWGHGSPASATGPWVKPSSAKPVPTGPPTSGTAGKQKTLAEIQREEELRKQKVKDTTAHSVAVPANVSKSYANLAGKPTSLPGFGAQQAPAPPPGAGWSTVGAGGKVKTPGAATTPGAQPAAVGTAAVKVPVAVPPKAAPAPKSIPAGKTDANPAMEEFNRWVHSELSRGIANGTDSESSPFKSAPLSREVGH